MMPGLNPYAKMKNSGVEWLGVVPKHWKVLPNRAVFSEINDRGHAQERMLAITISRGVIPQQELLKDGSKKDSSRLDRSGYKLVQPGDVAYNKMRAWQGALGVSSYRGIISPAYVVQRPRANALARYLHYLFRTPAFAKEAERWSYGITSDMWSLRPEHFRLIYSCIPPLGEQTAIARFLTHMDRRIQKYIRAKKKLIALLDEYRRAVIHQAVTGQFDVGTGELYPEYKESGVEWIGNVPRHWDLRRLKWATRLQRGYDLPADKRRPGPFPVVSSGGVIDSHVESRCTSPGVVMGRYGSTDAVFYVKKDFWPHNTSLFVTHFNGNSPRWSYYLLKSITKAAHSGKSAVPGIDRNDLFQITVSVPPRNEQELISKWIDTTRQSISRASTSVLLQIDLLREFRTRLIADVVTGKLDVRDVSATLREIDPLAGDGKTDKSLDTGNTPTFDQEDLPAGVAG